MTSKTEIELIKSLFKSLVWDNLVQAAIKKIFVAAPVLAWGPLGWLTSLIVNKVAGELYELLDKFIDLKAIAFKNKDLRKKYDRASVTLKILARSKGIDSDEFKEAREEHKKKLADLVRFSP